MTAVCRERNDLKDKFTWNQIKEDFALNGLINISIIIFLWLTYSCRYDTCFITFIALKVYIKCNYPTGSWQKLQFLAKKV